jgi:hypothetical protein
MSILKERTDRYQVGAAAQRRDAGRGDAAGARADHGAVAQPGADRPPPPPRRRRARHGNGTATGRHNGHGNGHADPRAVLPLDRDERGFGGF